MENIYDALFNNVFAVGIVAGDNIVAVESDKQRVRLISESENLVTTLISGFKAGKPAINKTRDKMYFIDVKSAKVYILRRENSWQPELLREGTPNYPPTMVKPGPALLTMKKNTSIQEITWGSSYVSI